MKPLKRQASVEHWSAEALGPLDCYNYLGSEMPCADLQHQRPARFTHSEPSWSRFIFLSLSFLFCKAEGLVTPAFTEHLRGLKQ